MKTTPNVGRVVGDNVRRIRGDRRQEDIASEMRSHGSTWSRATVAAIETGRRQIRLDELPIVCAVLECAAADLFAGDGEVRLADNARAALGDVRKFMLGKAKPVVLTDVVVTSKVMTSDEWRSWAAEQASRNEAEMTAARKLGVDPVDLSVAAFELWARSLTDERDERTAQRSPADASARTLQAVRGRVTRELVEQLRERIEEARDGER